MNRLSPQEQKLLKALSAGLRVRIYPKSRFIAITQDKKRFELSALTVNSLIGKAFLKETSDLKYLELTEEGKKEA